MEKPDMNQFYDKCMKEALHSKADEIITSGALFDRVSSEINDKKRGDIEMNKVFKSGRMKPALILALVLILSSTAAFAASQISSLRTGSGASETFDGFPTARQVEKAAGFSPDYVESFSNGFCFTHATVSNTEGLDADDNKVMEYKNLSFFYNDSKEEGDQKGQTMGLNAHQEKPELDGNAEQNEEVIPYGNIDLIYSKVTTKLVPEDYVPTKEEQSQIDKGALWLSCDGSDEIRTSEIQYVRWNKDGIAYNLMDQGYGIEKDDLISMAKEIID